ncbi:MAG: Crp/Fnr family transcriptional regulator [Chloroflexi bacterium]|nr:Crp/Fnr family transcriptional regulator [Chloroflexota bacterium]
MLQVEHLTHQPMAPTRAASPGVSLLQRIVDLKGVASAELASLGLLMCQCRYRRGETIQVEGAPYEGLLLILSGHIRASRSSAKGREKIFLVMGPGDILNLPSIILGRPAVASVVALEPTTICVIPTAQLVEAIHRDHAFALSMLRHLAESTISLTDAMTDQALLDVGARVAKVLLSHPGRVLRPRRRRGHVLTLTQEELAALVGSTRVVVARCIKDLREAEAIHQTRGKIEVLHRGYLRDLVQRGSK